MNYILILIVLMIIISIHIIIINYKNKEHMNNITNHTNQDSMYVNPDNINNHQIINEPYDITSNHIVNDRNTLNEYPFLKENNSIKYNYSYIDNKDKTNLETQIYHDKTYNQLKILQLDDLYEDTFKDIKKKIDINTDDNASITEKELAFSQMNIQTRLDDDTIITI